MATDRPLQWSQIDLVFTEDRYVSDHDDLLRFYWHPSRSRWVICWNNEIQELSLPRNTSIEEMKALTIALYRMEKNRE